MVDLSNACELDLLREETRVRMRSAAEKLASYESEKVRMLGAAPATAQDASQSEVLPQRRLSRLH